MNTMLVFEILQLAVALAQSQFSGAAAAEIAVAQTLVDIVQKGTEAYRQHTGQPLDPTLIKAETTI
jgi:hypothetical protein